MQMMRLRAREEGAAQGQHGALTEPYCLPCLETVTILCLGGGRWWDSHSGAEMAGSFIQVGIYAEGFSPPMSVLLYKQVSLCGLILNKTVPLGCPPRKRVPQEDGRSHTN